MRNLILKFYNNYEISTITRWKNFLKLIYFFLQIKSEASKFQFFFFLDKCYSLFVRIR